jgi:hypothetical protein
VLEQIAQQRRALRDGAAGVLAKLTEQGVAIRKGIAKIVELQREETGGVRRIARNASQLPSAQPAAAAHAAKLLVVGYVRRPHAAGTIKLRLKLTRSTLARLTRGRRSITLNLRVSMVLPSHLVGSGVPVSSIRAVKLTRGSQHR